MSSRLVSTIGRGLDTTGATREKLNNEIEEDFKKISSLVTIIPIWKEK